MPRIRPFMPALAAVALFAGGAQAQSFNIDFDVGIAGAWTNAPAATFPGAAHQAGFWNDTGIGPSAPGLRNTAGVATTANLAIGNLATGYFFDSPSTTGEYDRLLGDGCNSDAGQPLVLVFTNLRPGVYTVYTYASDPSAADAAVVSVTNAAEGAQTVAGNPASNAFSAGTTHSVHNVLVGSGQPLVISCLDPGSSARVGGVQLRYRGGAAARLFVNANSATPDNGASWSRALTSLSDALVAARFNDATTEIWVAQGTYYPTDGLDRDATFGLQTGLAIYGGFRGHETTVAARNTANNPTTLSGDISPRTDNGSYHVVSATDVFSSAILDGFTIRGGRADGPGQAHGGAGLWINDANPRIRNCTFRDNRAFEGAAVSFFAAHSLARFSNCTFIDNHADTFGGAVYYRGTNTSDVVFGNCRFLGNSGTLGGAVYALNGPVDFTNCVFSGNDGSIGGALYSFGTNTVVTLGNCTLTRNTADHNGGLAFTSGATSRVVNSVLWANSDTDPATNTQAANIAVVGSLATIDIDHSCVGGLTGSLGGVGMTGQNPLLTDPDGADNAIGTADDRPRLAPGSPCVDAGDNASIPADGADVDIDNNIAETVGVDLDHQARRVDVLSALDIGQGLGALVDMGAYEQPIPACLADFNGSGNASVQDIFDYLTAYFAGAPAADFNGLGGVTLQDLFDFLNAYFAGCP